MEEEKHARGILTRLSIVLAFTIGAYYIGYWVIGVSDLDTLGNLMINWILGVAILAAAAFLGLIARQILLWVLHGW